MLNRIRNWLWNRRRMIFRYHDGSRIQRIDPVQAAIALHEHPKYLPRHLSEAVNGNKDALQNVAQAATDVFGIPPLKDGQGMTLNERVEVMLAFDLYVSLLKKTP